jgi:hypothetical protein
LTTARRPSSHRRSVARAADESACKPGSVARAPREPAPAAISLGLALPTASSGPPAGSDGPPSNACAGVRRRPLDLAPGGVYRAARVTPGAGALLPHPFTLAPPRVPARRGGLLSVALSRGSPRVGVTHHPALWSPDFPRRDTGPSRCRHPTRPPGRLVRRRPMVGRQPSLRPPPIPTLREAVP